jgi:hypothetical protein
MLASATNGPIANFLKNAWDGYTAGEFCASDAIASIVTDIATDGGTIELAPEEAELCAQATEFAGGLANKLTSQMVANLVANAISSIAGLVGC